MRIGIGSWTYPWSIGVPGYTRPEAPLTAAGLIERARELRVKLVQIADNLPVGRGDLDVSSLDGIEVELGTRGVDPSHLLGRLDVARSIGARLLRTMIDEDLESAGPAIKSVLPEFEEAGVTLAIENYERHRTSDLAGLVASLNSDYCGICLDPVNSLGALENPDQVLAQLAPFVVCFHVKDFEIERVPGKMGFLVTGRPAGYGRLDLPCMLSQLARHGRRPNLILELWTPWTESLKSTIALEEEWARIGVAYLRQFENGGTAR